MRLVSPLESPTAGFLGALLLACLAGAAPGTAQQGRAPSGREIREGPYLRILLRDGSSGYLYSPEGARRAKKQPGLLVMLHGHGSTPKNFLLVPLARARGDLMLAVQGTEPVAAGGRHGFGWDLARGAAAVSGLVRYVLARHGADRRRVVLIGHSAGGTMALEACRTDPKRYAGVITISAPRTPTSAHKETRVWIFLGTEDPNFRVAPAVRAFGRKRGWRNLVLAVVAGAEHNNLPPLPQLLVAVGWCLAGRARGGEARIPYESRLAPARGPFGLLLAGDPGVPGWKAPRQSRRRRGEAKKLLMRIVHRARRGRAYLPFEALAYSEHPSYRQGGWVTRRELEAVAPELGEAAAKLKPGETSAPLATPKGWALIWRRPSR